jgi:hypothetical protein
MPHKTLQEKRKGATKKRERPNPPHKQQQQQRFPRFKPQTKTKNKNV